MRVFIVDDDPLARRLTARVVALRAREVREFESGDALLAALDVVPDLILLDIEMPGMDGLTVCRRLREHGERHPRVIFVSSHDDLATRVAAYEAGGDDFIVKPFSPEEMLRKFRGIERHARHCAQADDDVAATYAAEFDFVSSFGDVNVILESMRKMFACASPDSVGECMIGTLRQYGLTGLLQLRFGDVACDHATRNGRCSPLEGEILDRLRHLESLPEARGRTTVNLPHVSLLVTDLPAADGGRSRRLADSLQVLAEAAEVRMQGLSGEMDRVALRTEIADVVGELSCLCTDVQLPFQRINPALRALRERMEKLVSKHSGSIPVGALVAERSVSDPEEATVE